MQELGEKFCLVGEDGGKGAGMSKKVYFQFFYSEVHSFSSSLDTINIALPES